jgi:hypothetical protein
MRKIALGDTLGAAGGEGISDETYYPSIPGTQVFFTEDSARAIIKIRDKSSTENGHRDIESAPPLRQLKGYCGSAKISGRYPSGRCFC